MKFSDWLGATMRDYTNDILELIRFASTNLPPDVEKALRDGVNNEEAGSSAKAALDTILKNVEIARKNSTPICQDTGTPIIYVYYPEGLSTRKLRSQIVEAVRIATVKTYLRPNAVDPITGENSGDNSGDEHYPTVHFEEIDEDQPITFEVMLKGGGCENVGAQYKLPNAKLGAGRDLEGVRRVALDAVFQAQGRGCAPGILGIAVGGDRASSFIASKESLFRQLDDKNENSELAELEDRLTKESNQLGIGPMGFGGKTTVIGTKIKTAKRLPASYFVSVSYMCWANRRRKMVIDGDQVSYE
jgi:fumarate hydratase, class I